MSYYKEIKRAIREADHIINEVLYIQKDAIDLNKLELLQEPRFDCNFMKQFHKRLALHQQGDKTIIIDDNIVKIDEQQKLQNG